MKVYYCKSDTLKNFTLLRLSYAEKLPTLDFERLYLHEKFGRN